MQSFALSRGVGINKSTGEGISDASPCYCFIFIFSTFNALAYHNVGTCLWHVSIQQCINQRIGNMPKAKALKNYKIVNEVKILWRLVAVGNG